MGRQAARHQPRDRRTRHGHTAKQRRRAVTAAARACRMTIREFAAHSNMAVWYAHQAIDPATPGFRVMRSKKSRRSVRDSVRRAYARDSMAAQRRLTERVDGRLPIVHDPPVIVPVRELDTKGLGLDVDEWMKGLLDRYAGTLQPDRRHLIEQYRVVDVAHKVVGVGSVGSGGLYGTESVPQPRTPGRGRAAAHPGVWRHPALLAYDKARPTCGRLLRPSASGLEGCGGGRRTRP